MMTAFQGNDLFGALRLSSFAMNLDIMDEAGERPLIDAIGRSDLTPFRLHGRLGKRMVTSYGAGYDFHEDRLAFSSSMPAWLAALRLQCAALLRLDPELLTQVLLTRYGPGAGIGWHRDRPWYEHVIGISLGAPAVLRFRRRCSKRFDRINVPLAPRSLTI